MANKMDPKASEFIDEDAMKDMHPDAHQYIDTEHQRALSKKLSEKEGPSELESAMTGAGQGLTLNHAPQIGGLIGAGLEGGAGMLGMGPQATNAKLGLPQQSLSELYNQYKTAAQKRDEAAQQANPLSYGAGAVGGGMLGFKGAGMLAKPAVAALATRAPTLAATGQVMNRISPGAMGATLAGGLAAQGAGEHPITSPQGAEDIMQGMTGGLAASALMPPAISNVAQGAKKAAAGTKLVAGLGAEGLTGGEAGNAFSTGFGPKQGEGELLVGKQNQARVANEVNDFSGSVAPAIDDQLNKLAAQKTAIIRIAQEQGVRIDPEDIDAFMHEHMNAPTGDRSSVIREMQELKEQLERARSGPEIKQITRRYFGDGNTERGEFANLFSKKQAEQAAIDADTQARVTPTTQKQEFEQLHAQKQAEQAAVPGSNPNPLELNYEPIPNSKNVLGVIRQKNDGNTPNITYKKVASRMIDTGNTDHEAAMEELLEQKRAEQRAIPGSDPENLELHYEPTEVPDKTAAIIRQKQVDVGDPDTYNTVATKVIQPDAAPFDQPKLKMTLTPTDVPNQSLGQIHQAQFDKYGNFIKYKTVASKLLSDSEAADFKDVAETVRAGGRDLTEPEQLLDLYNNLKEKSKFGSEPFRSAEAQNETGRAIQNIQAMLRNNIEDLEPTDAKIHALNNAQEILKNIDQKDPYSAVQLMGGLIGKSGDASTVAGNQAQRRLADAMNQIKLANPELGHKIEAQAMNLASKMRVTAAAAEKAYIPRPLATPQAFVAKGANLLGYGIGQVTPDWMRQVGSAMASKGTQAGKMLSNVLTKAADKDDQTRTAIMFGLMQQPGYRDMLKEYMPQAQEHSTAKNKTLEKYK